MNICVASYNARGLRVGHSETDKSRRFVVDKILERCDILCVQETFLAKQDLEGLNSLHNDFHGAGESTTDLSAKIVRGGSQEGWPRFGIKNLTKELMSYGWELTGLLQLSCAVMIRK